MPTQEFLSVRHDRLLAAAAMLPPAVRPKFFTTLFMGLDALGLDGHPDDGGVDYAAPEEVGAKPKSYPLTVAQAQELKEKVDAATWDMIAAAVANVDGEGLAKLAWSDVMELTGVAGWEQFAKGRMGGLHRSLKKITGAPDKTILLFEHGFTNGETGFVAIDGPAVVSLRTVCGIKDT